MMDCAIMGAVRLHRIYQHNIIYNLYNYAIYTNYTKLLYDTKICNKLWSYSVNFICCVYMHAIYSIYTG